MGVERDGETTDFFLSTLMVPVCINLKKNHEVLVLATSP